MLATGVYASMHLANESVRESFWAATDRLAGSAELSIQGDEAGVPEEALDRARSVACVDAAAALMVRVVSTELAGESGLAVLGIDLLDEPRFREYQLEGADTGGIQDALSFLAQPDSVLVTRQLASRHGLAMNSPLAVWTGSEKRILRVRGFLAEVGVARAYNGNVAVMDVYAAQRTFGRRGLFDRIDLALVKGADANRCAAAVSQVVGAQLKVAPPPSRASGVQAFSNTYMLLIESSALLGALIAMFLVHHASAVAVAQRERDIAILLGLGADERAIGWLIVLESAAVGCAGAVGGVFAGWMGARHMGAALGRLLESGYGMSLAVVPPVVDWRWAVLTCAATAVFCALSSITPARNAATVPPIQLAEARRYSTIPEQRGAPAALVAAVCGTLAMLWQWYDRRPQALYVTLPLAALALGFGARSLTSAAFRALRRAFAWMWPLEGPLAVDGLIRANRKARGAVVGLSLTVATAMAISNLTAGYAHAFRTWARQLVNGDFLVHSSTNLASHGKLFPPEALERLRRTPGVAAVIPVRRINGEVEGRRAHIIGVDMKLWARHGGLIRAGAERGAVISKVFSRHIGRGVGSSIRVATPGGFLDLPVVDVAGDFSIETGTVYIDWETYRAHFRDDAIGMFVIYAAPGASKADVRRALAERLEAATPAMILDGEQLRAQADALVDKWRAVGFVQIAVAWLLSLAGTASFLVVSIRERRRELALLGVLGAVPEQLARSIVIEAVGVACASLLLGLPLGILLHTYLLLTMRYSVNGFDVPVVVDTWILVALVVAIPAATLLASLWPARSVKEMQLAGEVGADA